MSILQNLTFFIRTLEIGWQSGYNATIVSNQVFQMTSTTQIIPEACFASATRYYDTERDDTVGALCVFLALACGYDYRERRIPNYLILGMAVSGAGWRLYQERAPGAFWYLGQAVLVMAVLYPFFKTGGLGAGDVKLLGMTAGYLPAEKILGFLFCSLLVAAMISLVKILKKTDRRVRRGVCLSGPVFVSILMFLGGVY